MAWAELRHLVNLWAIWAGTGALPVLWRAGQVTSHHRYCSFSSSSVSWMLVSACVFTVVLYCSPNKHDDCSINCNLKLQGFCSATFHLLYFTPANCTVRAVLPAKWFLLLKISNMHSQMGFCHSLIFKDTVCSQVIFEIGVLATSENKSLTSGGFQFVLFCHFFYPKTNKMPNFRNTRMQPLPLQNRCCCFLLSVWK